MSEDYCSNFELKLAYHTAPSLYGIKVSSLLKVKKNEYMSYIKSETVERFEASGIKTRVINEDNDGYLILVYNEKVLKKHIDTYSNRKFLSLYGYEKCNELSEYIDHLSSRIKESGSFPHEIGVFLGYPLEDIDGFIRNKGRNFKLCGFWKVYSDEERARKTFRTYRQCRKYLCNKISNGAGICEALGLM